jgi:UDP-N-acetylmuramate dehydrogenase
MSMLDVLVNILGSENVLVSEPMSNHTTFKIGGAAEYFLTPQTESQLVALVKALNEKKCPFIVIGNGSNLLVSDKGISGAVISLYKNMSDIRVENEIIYAECGALLSRVSTEALKNHLEGFEFASGIPGTVGGGVYMNAGAYGGELKDIVETVRYMDMSGSVFEISSEMCGFGYRHSIFSENEYIILGASFKLKKGDENEIRQKIDDFNNRRKEKQPVDKPSAGSTFKRPEGYFAGTLIEQAGLKGFAIGGAQISEKHAGFVINKGGATAKDVVALIEHVKNVIFEKNGVKLEPEIKFVGHF